MAGKSEGAELLAKATPRLRAEGPPAQPGFLARGFYDTEELTERGQPAPWA